MARGVSLDSLVEQLKAETGHSVSVSVGVDQVPLFKQTIRRVQETLYDDYDWPHLRVMPTKDLAAGQRHYDLPTDLNLERIEEVAIWYSNSAEPISRGISFEHYSQYNSENDERADPVRAWDLRWTGSATQVEVWPIPAGDDQYLQFRGIRNLRALTEGADVADLDDRLIVLFAAAEILARQKSADAQVKLNLAQSRYSRLKGRVTGGADMIRLGGSATDKPIRGTIIRIGA